MPRVVHFEIPIDDEKRAVKFYSDVFGWKINSWGGPEPYWLADTGEGMGINGALMQRSKPNEGTINTIDVPDIDAYMKKITDSGGKVLMQKTEIPHVGWYAYCLDTEGNQFGIMQPLQGA